MPNHVTNTLTIQPIETDHDAVIERVHQLVLNDDGQFDFNKLIPQPPTMKITSGSVPEKADRIISGLVIPQAIKNKIANLNTAEQKALGGYVGFLQVNANYLSPKFAEEFDINIGEILLLMGNDFCHWMIEEGNLLHSFMSDPETDPMRKKLTEIDSQAMSIVSGMLYEYNQIRYGCHTWYDWSYEYWGTKWNAYSQCVDGDVIQFDTAWATPMPIWEKLVDICQNEPVEFRVGYADEDIGRNMGDLYITAAGVKELDVPAEGTEKAYRYAMQIKGWPQDEIEQYIEDLKTDKRLS